MNVRSLILSGLVLSLAGCAMAPPPHRRAVVPTEPQPSAAEDEAAWKAALDDLAQHKAEMTVPRANSDCQPMCRAGELICAASERICQIASRHPDQPSYGERCRGAEQDCKDAQKDCDNCQ